MKSKLLVSVSAAILSLGMGSANAAPVQLTTAQMDNVSAGVRNIRNSALVQLNLGLQIAVTNAVNIGNGAAVAIVAQSQTFTNRIR